MSAPPFEHQRCHRMPEQMTRAVLVDLRRLDILARRPAEIVGADRFAVVAHKHRGVVRLDHQQGPRFVQTLPDPEARPFSDSFHTDLSAGYTCLR